MKKLIQTFSKTDIKWFSLTLLLIPFLEIPRMLRFNILLRLEGIRLDLKSIFLSYQSSIFFGNISPLRAGDFYKIRYFKIPTFKGIILVMADRGFDFILLVVSGIYSFGVFKDSITLRFVALSISIFLILSFVFIRIFGKKIKFLERILKKTSTIDLLTKWTLKDAFFLTLYSITATLLFFFFNHLILNLTMSTDVSFTDVILIVSMVSLSNIIPITISGIGTREALSLLILSSYGLKQETAITYGALAFILTMLAASIYSFLIWLLAQKHFKYTYD
ncbi:MAG: hypothetical protein C0601_01510 [Candidatus Muiribacterium halophilum]|uniref:Flippase-like domain-containing protein n=1 Tax=Muiribacterium halophilum TaxID=2053465 RepID=A0A2N5ZLI9_MUIH1|nr:MAG: hypothetical protein C0601_01510 [Candidatus Muirbacterium halophilum]